MLVLLSALLTGALAGAMALPHCVAMCGPFAAFACAGSTEDRVRDRADVRYLGARSLGYAALGAVAGGSGGLASAWLPPTWASVLLAVTLAAGMLSLAWRLVRAERSAQRARDRLVQLGGKPLSRGPSFPSRALHGALALVSGSPIALGFATALFPCGALYAAMLVAAGTGSAWAGTASMLGFSVTSALALGISGWVARASMALDRQTRLALGVALVLGAVVLVARPLLQSGEAAPPCHANAVGEAR
jgi:sulfite exporter TauE/SafE